MIKWSQIHAVEMDAVNIGYIHEFMIVQSSISDLQHLICNTCLVMHLPTTAKTFSRKYGELQYRHHITGITSQMHMWCRCIMLNVTGSVYSKR